VLPLGWGAATMHPCDGYYLTKPPSYFIIFTYFAFYYPYKLAKQNLYPVKHFGCNFIETLCYCFTPKLAYSFL
jgi:hypothetical protein